MPFIDCDSELWLEFLNCTPHDIYHLPGYAEIDAKLLGGKAIAWIFNQHNASCLIPLIERPLFNASSDLISPYGYPGILVSNTRSENMDHAQAEDVIQVMLKDFNLEAAEAGYISSFIRLDPLRNAWNFQLTDNMELINDEIKHYTQIFPGETLSVSPQQLNNRKHFNCNLRRDIRHLKESGHQVIVNDWSLYGDFIQAYRQTMTRKKAAAYYHFPDWYFSRLIEIAEDHLVLISVISHEGRYQGGALFIHYNGIMQYHLSATTNEAVRLSPSKLILETASFYAHDHQVTTLHLGGGAGSITDGLYHFKRRFSTHSHSFSCLKFIHRPDLYNELCAGKRGVHFPEYRT